MREARLEKILSILRQRIHITVKELAKELEVSELTIRRDLKFLESQGFVKRTHGGVIFRGLDRNIPFFYKLEEKKTKKKKIAKKAVEFLKDGQTVFVSGGTTVYYTIQALDNTALMNLTFITNSITTAWAVITLKKRFELIHTGGTVRQGSFECIGGRVAEIVNKLNVDVFLLGVDGIDLERGITFENYEESLIAQIIWRNSEKKIVVTDDSKFGKIAPYRVADINSVDYIITNASDKTEKFRFFLKGSKTKLILA